MYKTYRIEFTSPKTHHAHAHTNLGSYFWLNHFVIKIAKSLCQVKEKKKKKEYFEYIMFISQGWQIDVNEDITMIAHFKY